MVRVNIINPKQLTDQHLIAEYNEILMLVAYIKKYPEIKNIPEHYTLNKGHMKFFKDKTIYLKERHELIKKEMKKRNFVTTKTISLKDFKKHNKNNWKPRPKDKEIIKARIKQKLKMKPEFYRYYGKHYGLDYYLDLLKG